MKRPIHITSHDKQLLENQLAQVQATRSKPRADLEALAAELERAVVVDPRAVPGDVITMNSRAELLDLDSGETATFALVFPLHANIDDGKISVLAPIGTGMLGHRVGDEFEWKVPSGVRRMRVIQMRYQPEAARLKSAA
ncbi:MAG TPA: nucleoside diphosphate kinase regulator [Candidatus Udaeobacter sp.]|nr:nucleoside diphosphate kinase regulator [Candidatus Udaeobacter sp.]